MMSEFFVHLLSLNSRVASTVEHEASVYLVTFIPPLLGGATAAPVAFKPFAATTDWERREEMEEGRKGVCE
jgi:hypothetical protein